MRNYRGRIRQNIVPGKTVENTQEKQYTASGVTTIIDKFTATNYSGTAATISVNLVTTGGSAGNTNLVTKTKTLQPAEVYTFPELVGQVLNPGDFISTLAGTAGRSICESAVVKSPDVRLPDDVWQVIKDHMLTYKTRNVPDELREILRTSRQH